MKISRRKFLATSALVPVLPSLLLKGQTAEAGPNLLGATDKAGTSLPIIGQGEHTYEFIQNWGELPSSIVWGNVHNAAEDEQGNLHVHHTVGAGSTVKDSMVVFDRNGKFIRSWGREFRGVAHGLWLRREGNTEYLYLTEQNLSNNNAGTPPPEVSSAVVKTTLSGDIVWELKGPPPIPEYTTPINGRLPNYNPTNVAFAPNGDLYVADGYGHYYINQYDSRGNHLRSFGGRAPGANPFTYGAPLSTGVDGPLGFFVEPHGIWVDTRTANPLLWVTDRRNFRIQRFTLDGKVVDKISEPFGADRGLPSHFHERNGQVVIGELQGRLTILDQNNRTVAQLGARPPVAAGSRGGGPLPPGVLTAGHGAIFDHAGNLFVSQYNGRTFTKLRKVA